MQYGYDEHDNNNMSNETKCETNYNMNDRVRKMLDQSPKDAKQDGNKHSLTWRMFVSSTLQPSLFM